MLQGLDFVSCTVGCLVCEGINIIQITSKFHNRSPVTVLSPTHGDRLNTDVRRSWQKMGCLIHTELSTMKFEICQ